MTYYVELFKALVKGDDVDVQAIKNQRLSTAALTAHIAVATGEIVRLETKVGTAQENLKNALANKGVLIEYNEDYVEKLLIAKNNVTIAEKNLATKTGNIKFLEEQLELVKREAPKANQAKTSN
jgi:hypothetical protein